MPRTVRKAIPEWEQGFTGTIPKEVGAAGSGEASVAARPAGSNLRQHVWLLKIPSPTTNPLRFSRIPRTHDGSLELGGGGQGSSPAIFP